MADGSGGAPGRLFVVSGPSGVGKGSVIAEVIDLRPDVWLSVSTTTRAPRPGESEGVHYHFLDEAEFRTERSRGGFLESAEYAGHLYGTARAPVAEMLARSRPVILEIDLRGARQVRRAMPDALQVQIIPPDMEQLEHRLRNRGTEDEANVARRLALAQEELAAGDEFDHVLRNDEVRSTARELLQLLDQG